MHPIGIAAATTEKMARVSSSENKTTHQKDRNPELFNGESKMRRGSPVAKPPAGPPSDRQFLPRHRLPPAFLFHATRDACSFSVYYMSSHQLTAALSSSFFLSLLLRSPHTKPSFIFRFEADGLGLATHYIFHSTARTAHCIFFLFCKRLKNMVVLVIGV